MNVLVYALLFLLAAWLIYVGRYSGRLKAQRTRLIQAPLPAVFAAIADLGEWAHWCPWLDPESTQPGPTLTPSAQAVLAWRNPLHGQGEIRTLRQTPGQRIVQQGRWSLPFAVKGTLVWNLVERGDHTELRWSFKGRVGFTLRFVAPTVQAAIEMEFRYAMDRLAQRLEPHNALHYDITLLGLRDTPALAYLGLTYDGPIQGLPQARQDSFERLQRQLRDGGVAGAGDPVAVYVRTNTRLRTTLCHLGIPVAGTPNLDGASLRQLSAQPAYAAQLQGNLAALDIAWYWAMKAMLALQLTANQQQPPFEQYTWPAEWPAEPAPGGSGTVTLYLPVLALANGHSA